MPENYPKQGDPQPKGKREKPRMFSNEQADNPASNQKGKDGNARIIPGWADIATYVTQFGLTWGSTPVGISTSTFLLQLKNIESKINTVSIDACTEHARQLVIGSLDNIIYGLQLIFDNPNDSQVHDVKVKGVTMIDDANVELADLGIDITLSLKCSFQIRCSPISGLVDNHPLQLNKTAT